MRKPAYRVVIAAAFALVLSIGTVLVFAEDPVTTGNGAYSVGLGWSSHPPGKFANIELGVACYEGFTCGLTKFEVDWDDGTIDTVYGYTFFSHSFQHTYANTGLRHAKVMIEGTDESGNWADVRPLDILIDN